MGQLTNRLNTSLTADVNLNLPSIPRPKPLPLPIRHGNLDITAGKCSKKISPAWLAVCRRRREEAEGLDSILYADGLDIYTNDSPPPFMHLTSKTNIAGYMCWGAHSALRGDYPTDNKVIWAGTNRWWIIETVESPNGQRASSSGNFIKWFSSNAFGTNDYYSNTPVGTVSHVDEPKLFGTSDAVKYFGPWASGKNFAIAAWNSRLTPYFQAV